MSTNKTTNLGLHSWERSDRFSMDEFNENFNKLDQAVGEANTALSTEAQARQSAVDAEAKARQSAVDAEAKARQSAVDAETKARQNALSTELAERQSADNALKSEIAQVRAENLWVRIGTATASGNSTRLDLNLSGVKLTDYAALELCVDVNTGLDTAYIGLNGLTDAVFDTSTSYGTTSARSVNALFTLTRGRSAKLSLSQPRAGERAVGKAETYYTVGANIRSEIAINRAPVNWEDVTSFNLWHSSDNIPAGSTIALYGLKK